jgi:hypothetical protein
MPWLLVVVAVGWIVLAPPIYDHSRPATRTPATVFIAIVGGLFVWSVVRDALVGMDYGFALVKWSSDPGVFRTELILALCAAIVTFVSVWKIARSNRATGQIVMWLGWVCSAWEYSVAAWGRPDSRWWHCSTSWNAARWAT